MPGHGLEEGMFSLLFNFDALCSKWFLNVLSVGPELYKLIIYLVFAAQDRDNRPRTPHVCSIKDTAVSLTFGWGRSVLSFDHYLFPSLLLRHVLFVPSRPFFSLSPVPFSRKSHRSTLSCYNISALIMDANMEPIAIVGMSCRLPGNVSTLDSFWTLMSRARSGWCEIPKDRISKEGYWHPNPEKKGCFNSSGGYFLQGDVGEFDATFFNITQAEAQAMGM